MMFSAENRPDWMTSLRDNAFIMFHFRILWNHKLFIRCGDTVSNKVETGFSMNPMEIISGALESGWTALMDYVTQHTLTCQIPALFIAGAIAAFVKREAILKYFGPDVKKYKSHPLAAVSGVILAVCSCTILPLFAGNLQERKRYRTRNRFPLLRSCYQYPSG